MDMKADRMKQRTRFSLLLLMIVVMVLALAGIAAARYTMQKRGSGLVAAKDFYFISDLLKEESEKAEYFIDPDSNISIELYNYADSLRITPGTIQYGVEADGGQCMDPSGNQLVTGTVPGSVTAQKATLTITPDAGANDVIVTVTSSKPYRKVLTAAFHRESGNLASMEDASGNRAAVLTMTCADSAKNITIELPRDVIPDQTDDRVTYTSGPSTCTFASPGYGVYSLVLLKSDKTTELTVGSGETFADKITINSK